MRFLANTLYVGKEPSAYTNEPEKYNCFIPCSSGDFIIGDCWVVDENGNVDPGLSSCGVPVHFESLGQILKENIQVQNTEEFDGLWRY